MRWAGIFSSHIEAEENARMYMFAHHCVLDGFVLGLGWTCSESRVVGGLV